MSEIDISVISTPYFQQPADLMGSVEKVSFQRFQELKKYGYEVNFIAPLRVNDNEKNHQAISLVEPSRVPDKRNKIRFMYSTRSFDYFMPYLQIPQNKIGKVVFFDGWRLEPWDFFPLRMKFRGSKVINILHPPVIFIDRIPIRFLSPLYKRSTWGALNSRINEYFLIHGYKSVYLPNGINIPEKDKVISNPDEFLISFGRIEPAKAPHLAIKLARSLEIPLKIFGRIIDHNYFESKIKPHIDSVNIIFCGEVSYAELFENLRRAKATVYFSDTYDPLPTVLLESISFGVPVIGYGANPLSGFHDIIGNGINGILINPDDMTLKIPGSKLLKTLDNIDRYSIYTSTRKKWSWESIIREHYCRLLEGLLSR